MRSLILTAILLATAFSGCLVEPAGPQSVTVSESTSPSASTTPTNSSSTSTTAAPTTSQAVNTPPTAKLSSDAQNGTAPLNVTFSIEGTDADGDELSWTLDVDGDNESDYNGTNVPTAFVHEYVEAGNYTVVLNITDGQAFAESNVTIVVEGVPAAKEDAWAVWDELGQCHAKGAIEIPGTGHYLHERGDPPGTGFVLGDGTWIYEESNGVEGLQLGGAAEGAAYVDCVNPDHLVF